MQASVGRYLSEDLPEIVFYLCSGFADTCSILKGEKTDLPPAFAEMFAYLLPIVHICSGFIKDGVK